MTPDQKTALDLRNSGLSRDAIADRMGRTARSVKDLLEKARAWQIADPAAQKAAKDTGANVLPHSFWRKEDGISAYYKVAHDDAAKENWLASVAEAFRDIPAYEAKPFSADHNDLMTIYPLYDMHAGQLSWGAATSGPDYDLDLFKADLMNGIQSIATDSHHGVVVFGGDNLHMNDGKNMTPGSGHILDTDGRFEKVVDVTIESTCSAIEYLLTRHAKLTVIVLAGNHDIEAHLILKSALKQRYRDIDRITFYADPREIKYLRHGNFLAFFHHGDKMKPEKLCMIAADQSKDWSMCKYRVAFTGHLHHLRMTDFPGVTHITLRAFAPADAYGANFGGIRGICAFTVDAEKGLKRVDYENMERG